MFDLVQKLEAAGAEVVGPVPNVQMAMQKVLTTPGLHAALLDINLQGAKVFPLADMLQDRRIPIVFASAYDRSVIPGRHAGSRLLAKPLQIDDVLNALSVKFEAYSERVRASENRILGAVDDDCADALGPLLTPVRLAKGDLLARTNEEVWRLVFVERGMVSVVAETGQGQELEVGLIGREGFFGAQVILEDKRSICTAVVQIAGDGLAMELADFCEVCGRYPKLRSLAARYLRTFQIQTTFAALVNAKFNLEHRLARWLLMVDDRIPGNCVRLTHDLLALMLGAHRPGVTLALQALEGHGYIRSLRGEVQIRNRAALVEFAGGSYGIPEREYQRLMRLDPIAHTDRAAGPPTTDRKQGMLPYRE